ncbi:hypothetical protein MHL_2659 [Mesomycoplasma hyopneumoniae 7422]|nr:hypothetical protein MHL_2659 [Mesomycoplasma hyopneumoniae 7422]
MGIKLRFFIFFAKKQKNPLESEGGTKNLKGHMNECVTTIKKFFAVFFFFFLFCFVFWGSPKVATTTPSKLNSNFLFLDWNRFVKIL